MLTCRLLSVGWSFGAQTLVRCEDEFGYDAPAKAPLPALCSDYGNVVGPIVVTTALKAIRDKVDIPESRLTEGGKTEKLR